MASSGVNPNRSKRQVSEKTLVMRKTCEICGATVSRTSYYRHVRTHNPEKRHKCTVCERTFSDISYLTQHRNRYPGNKNVKCEVCARIVHRRHYRQHAKGHPREKKTKNAPFNLQCVFCSCKPISSYDLQIHMRKHTLERPYFCKFCPLEFVSRKNRNNHAKAHFPHKLIPCHFCPKLIHPRNLQTHILNHTGEKYYKCKICAKGFANSKGLKSHLRFVHSDERPFGCELCDKRFKSTTDKNKHKQGVHSEERKFSCKFCKQSFKLRSQMATHQNRRSCWWHKSNYTRKRLE